jgi:iron(III) transport system substrate-binding protein
MLRCFAVLGVTILAGCSRPATDRVVLYSAQDRPFAEAALADFTKTTGLTVAAKYDTEANKSVGLFRELQLEASRPRCDVHWNNEILTTLMLAKQGLLELYSSPAAADYPTFAKATDHAWTAFAARVRVILVNTDKVKEVPQRLLDLTDPTWKGQLAMAKPLHGTTATQAACMFEVLGADGAKAFYRGLRANGVQIVPGNKQVAEAVGRGDASIGLTDTDDAMDEVLAGRPVAIVFPDATGGTDQHPRMGTLFIPNTVAVVKGGPNSAGARKLVDYLLSPEIEKRLATAGGYQIPLNPKVEADLPVVLRPARQAKPMQVDFAKAAAMWEEVQAFLRDEFAR